MHTPDLFDASSDPRSPAPVPASTTVSAITPAEVLASAESILSLLADWTDHAWLRPLDLALVRFFHQQVPDCPALTLLLTALTSHQNGRGHVCLDITATLAHPERALSLPPDEEALEAAPLTPETLLGEVSLTDCVTALTAVPGLVERATMVADQPVSEPPPLVLGPNTNRPLLYLRRYWHFETAIEQAVRQRLAKPIDLPVAHLQNTLRALFDHSVQSDGDQQQHPDWQTIACALAARQRFAIITGGPGTGKTTTVVKLLALLQSLALSDPESAPTPLRIALTAPTGKAAARLNESIAGQVAKLPLDDLPAAERVRSNIPTQVTTLHRLLGVRAGSRQFRHHAGNRLHLDLVVVDEASMVDVEMMARLLDALSANTRVILLGDKDQLASVEAGAVLGNLCQRADGGHYTRDTIAWLEQATGQTVPDAMQDPRGQPLDQAITMLRHSHRFSADSGIGQLAQAVNQGDAQRAEQLLNPSINHPDLARQSLNEHLDAWLVDGYRHYLEILHNGDPGQSSNPDHYDFWAQQVLYAHNDFQLLCALRRGPQGVLALNQRIARALDREGLINAEAIWYPGRPVLITRNDYHLQLMNGDIGITMSYPVRDDNGQPRRQLRVAFPAGDGTDGIRWVLPSRLQQVETVYAMTVHKSQGSEFRHTALMLPQYHNPGLTRELVYTGITRARSLFTLVDGKPEVLNNAIHAQVQRVSGMMLWSDDQQ